MPFITPNLPARWIYHDKKKLLPQLNSLHIFRIQMKLKDYRIWKKLNSCNMIMASANEAHTQKLAAQSGNGIFS